MKKLFVLLFSSIFVFSMLFANGTVQAKDTKPPKTLTVNKVSNKTTSVSGKTEAKVSVEVKFGGELLGKATADSKGNFKVTIKAQKKGTRLTVIATDKAGNAKKITVTVYGAPNPLNVSKTVEKDGIKFDVTFSSKDFKPKGRLTAKIKATNISEEAIPYVHFDRYDRGVKANIFADDNGQVVTDSKKPIRNGLKDLQAVKYSTLAPGQTTEETQELYLPTNGLNDHVYAKVTFQKTIEARGSLAPIEVQIDIKTITIAEQFPDANLAQAVADWLGKDTNDPITKEDINNKVQNSDYNDSSGDDLVVLDLDNYGISDATGIDIFGDTDLDVINLSRNNLTSFDARGLTNIKKLGLSKNQLTSVDVSGLTQLTNLGLSNNQLTNLDVSDLTSLQNLNVRTNQLTSLEIEISGVTNMEELYLEDNELTNLDVSGLTNLEELYVQDNELTSLDVSGLTNLDYLDVHNNQLTSLDVSGLTNLDHLDARNNELTSLDVSVLTNLNYLDARNNELTSLDVSGLTNLGYLYMENNELTTLDVSGLTNLNYLDARNNQLTSLGVSGLTNLHTLFVSPLEVDDIVGEEALNLMNKDF